ncbi:hypothetical protein AYI69_g985 [Smittium culicis]|uniref:Uncharacterized protein n=1 Tax=Smittium culicis TaxID=133412 RepID=A0A1R1YRI5_9FUNG|nr:hypothetical protein AYI69_g985 [Smittium culicis]
MACAFQIKDNRDFIDAKFILISFISLLRRAMDRDKITQIKYSSNSPALIEIVIRYEYNLCVFPYTSDMVFLDISIDSSSEILFEAAGVTILLLLYECKVK